MTVARKTRDMIFAHDVAINARQHLLDRYHAKWDQDAAYSFVQWSAHQPGSVEWSQVQGDYAACRLLEAMHALIAYTWKD